MNRKRPDSASMHMQTARASASKSCAARGSREFVYFFFATDFFFTPVFFVEAVFFFVEAFFALAFFPVVFFVAAFFDDFFFADALALAFSRSSFAHSFKFSRIVFQ